jgi:hypothetical protein
MAFIYREVYVGCGQRRDGRWDAIVIPPGAGRDDVRVVQPDLGNFGRGRDCRAVARTRTRVSSGGGLLSG